jgi:hypothetical protein
MKRITALLIVLGCALSAHAEDVSHYTIVLPAEATPAERRGGDELRHHLKEMCGAELPVVKDDQALPSHAILLGGNNRQLTALNVKLDASKLGDEGFILRSVGDHLVVAGPGKRGTMYACTTLLEKLGVRWFTPTITRVPHVKTLEIPTLDETQTPVFEYREIYIHEALQKDWAARLKTNGHHSALDETTGGKMIYGAFVHTFDDLIPQNLFSTHPEYFPVIKRKRENGYVQRCLTNPDVLKLTIEKLRNWMEKNPAATIFSVSQNDCYKFCECDACKAIEQKFGGSHSGLYLWFVNQVAEAVEREFPDKIVDTIAYQFTEAPPEGIEPRKNVRVRLCPIAMCEAHPLETCTDNASVAFAKRLAKWNKVSGGNLYVWHYCIDFSHYLAPFPGFRQFPDSIRLYKRSGVKGIFFQGCYNTPGGAEAELRTYVMAKLLWDANADADALVTEWMRGVSGERAAVPMRKWFDLLHDAAAAPDKHLHVHGDSPLKYLTPAVLDQGDKLFDEAQRFASGDEVATKEIAKARMWLRYGQLRTAMKKGPQLDKFLADAKALHITQVRESSDIPTWTAEFK